MVGGLLVAVKQIMADQDIKLAGVLRLPARVSARRAWAWPRARGRRCGRQFGVGALLGGSRLTTSLAKGRQAPLRGTTFQ